MGHNDPTNSSTKAQFNRFFENAVDKARNPDIREKFKKIRQEKSKKIAKTYGL